MQEMDPLAQFLSLSAADDLVRLQLTQAPSEGGAVVGATRLLIRPVLLREQPHWQAVWRHPTKDLTENWPADEGPRRLAALLAQGWRSAALWTTQAHWQLDRHRKGHWRLIRHRGGSSAPVAAQHNIDKRRPLELAHPAWAALGLTEMGRDAQPRLVPAMARKWKQINHFVEILDAALRNADLPSDRPLRVADFGCGRGYLTFAVALRLAAQGRASEVLGVELRDDLVAQTETLARELQIEGLHFAQGDVGHAEVQPLDLMIALHACDTATDHALHHGLRAGAQVIICAPCCHKQLRGQLQPPKALRPLFKHGVHLGQEAEMLTDGLRALLLEAHGYDTQVFEFVALEHTQKNKMILAVRREGAATERAAAVQQQISELKAFWQVREHCLEQLLLGSGG
jgi:SAM-dependent methyltransferase